MSEAKAESSEKIRDRVVKAREKQLQRLKGTKRITNSELKATDIKNCCHLSDKSMELLKSAIDRLYLSARSYTKILKIARTIADLDESDDIKTQHVAEALQYRPKG
jgi:magnesium chelatase family protein